MTILNGAVSNTVACLTFGQRFDYHDEYYQRILRLDNECVQLAGSYRAQVLIHNNILRHYFHILLVNYDSKAVLTINYVIFHSCIMCVLGSWNTYLAPIRLFFPTISK